MEKHIAVMESYLGALRNAYVCQTKQDSWQLPCTSYTPLITPVLCEFLDDILVVVGIEPLSTALLDLTTELCFPMQWDCAMKYLIQDRCLIQNKAL